MKRFIILLMAFLLIGVVAAQEDRVYIINFEYDNGIISLVDKIVKVGYYPDGKLQAEEGHSCVIFNNDKVLYNLTFEIPLIVFTDVLDENNMMVGSVMRLNETNFALILPYFDEANEIRCYNPKNYLIIEESLADVKLGPEKPLTSGFFPWLVFIILALIGLMIIILRHRKK